MSEVSLGRAGQAAGRPIRFSPGALLGLAAAGLAALAALPLTLPIGPMYWDLVLYFDAANRIGDGQVPAVDFFAPVGALGYWLFAAAIRMFPQGQPLLLADWSILTVTAPLMALVVRDVGKRAVGTAFALLVPFLVFSILPFNVEVYTNFPGVDGFGIYNRQASRILFVLAAALLFVEDRRSLGVVVAGAMLALFLTKITGFVSGGLLCLFAFAAGRLPFRVAGLAALGFAAALALLEATLGLVGAYGRSVAALVAMNEGALLPRFLQAGSIHVAVLAPLLALVATLLAFTRRDIVGSTRSLAARRRPADVATFLDRDAFWLGVAAFAALFFETQNTGGLAFVFVWPALLRTLLNSHAFHGGRFIAVAALIAASSLPTLTGVAGRAIRAGVVQLKYQAFAHRNLGGMGAVSDRIEYRRHADAAMRGYQTFPATYQGFVEAGELPIFTLYAQPDFQLNWLRATDEAVDAVRAFEAANGVRFETILNLNFANPFPWLLDRSAPRHVAIGADPSRAVPPPDARVREAVRAVDLALYPKCPQTIANEQILRIYAPFLADHRRVTLSACWDAFLRVGLARRAD